MGKVDTVKLYDRSKRGCWWDGYVGDRFIGARIRRRHAVSLHHYERISEDRRKDLLFQDMKEERKERYKRRLRTILNVPEPFESILKITSGQESFKYIERHWPVRARRYPFLSAPEIVLDMPHFSADMSLNILDWGKTGLASSLGDTVFIWNGSKEIKKITGFHDQTNGEMVASALKWNKNGNLLAIGMQRSCIQVWDTSPFKKAEEFWCVCATNSGCVIAALEWHPMNHALVSGCSNGVMQFHAGTSYILPVVEPLPCINSLTFSHDGCWLAFSSFYGTLKIARWPQHKEIVTIQNISTCRAYAWHPWDSSLMVTAGTTNKGDIFLWNIKTLSVIAKYVTCCLSKVVALTWSPLTAELVVSMQVHCSENVEVDVWRTEILVLASFKKAVDRLDMNGTSSYTPYIFFSPDGHEIAAGSSDETLRIWNFLGVEKMRSPFPAYKKPVKCRRLNVNGCWVAPFDYISCVIR